jgi:DNA polymerase-1
MKWSKRLLELFPCLLLDQEEYPKIDSFLTAMCKNTIFDDREKLVSLRKRIKNLLVFPWFYGASKFSVSAAISTEYREVPEYVMNELYEEFWETYPMVKVWQRDQINFYNKYGYVKSLTGRRRRLPLKFNEVINHCIQSSASYDICLVAGDRLSKLGYELWKPQYQYFSNVHDELNFYIPYSTLVEDIETIAKEMVRPAYYFINVPLEVECKVGYNWFDLEDYWKFSTLDWWEYKNEEWIEK